MYAQDKGYFAKVGLDLDLAKQTGPSSAVLPMLARGDLDILPTTPAPGLFNQAIQGFDIKIIASLGLEKPGRLADVSLMVPKAEAGQFKELTDLRGKTIDGAVEGTPTALTAIEAIRSAGLTPGKDVTLTYKARTVPDMVTLVKNQGADVVTMLEPVASQAVSEGYAVRWKTLADIAPWYQPSFLLASTQTLNKNRAAFDKFMAVYLLASREIDATNGQWTPDLVKPLAAWTGQTEDVIKSQGLVTYYDPNGAVSTDSLDRTQTLWQSLDLVKQKVDVQQLVDLGSLNTALGAVGKA